MTMTDLAKLIKNPPIECRPELRWWLAEGLHTDETLRHEIDVAHRLGFGAWSSSPWTRATSTTRAMAGAQRSGSTTPRSPRRLGRR